ncbi:uncharacterized protein LOC133817696 [Humulus lupulus]|uniref:uncharacterized protein LOC133817696 n=1 Tax=Humulus lupulus TaxID=3486 RepID=UPI002B40C9FE|nr:uncharacterized protein LOC133817696 [Humulus lupulus]
MAVGGSYSKGNGYGNSSGNSNSNRGGSGRPYGLMLLIAFGAALLGVMILHKLRERRIFNLLVDDKDRDIFSLQLLLQKERDYTKEAKMKNEELKAKIYSLRIQKMEIDRRLVEMQSTIESLKDEGKTMEVAIEEKQNEIKVLRLQQETANEKENSQVMALTVTLKQKDVEIEDLKRRLQYPEKVWSVSTDDSSKQSVNLTLAEDQKEKTGAKTVVGDDESSNKTAVGEVSNDDRREMMSKEKEKNENLLDQMNNKDGFSTGGETIDATGLKVSEEITVANSSDVISKNGGMKTGKHESRKNLATVKGGMKLEIQDDSGNFVEFIARGKRGSASSNSTGKRWRLMGKNRRSEKNGKQNRVKNTRSTRFNDNDDQAKSKGRVNKAASIGIPMGGNHLLEAKIPELLSSENRSTTEERQPSNKLQTSLPREMLLNTSTVGGQSKTRMELEGKKPEVRKLHDQEAIAVEQGMNRKDISKETTDDVKGFKDYRTREEQEQEKFAGDEEQDYTEEVDESEF